MLKTIEGKWVSCNKFEDNNGVMRVVPMNYIHELYRGKWPFDCFILLEDNRRIVSVFPKDLP